MFNHDQFWWDLLSTFVKSRVRPSQHSDGMFELSIAIHNLFKLIYRSLEFIIYSLIYSYLFIIYQESGLINHYPFQKWPNILLRNTLNKKRCRSARRDGKRGHLLCGRESEWRCRSWDNDRRGCHAQPGIKKGKAWHPWHPWLATLVHTCTYQCVLSRIHLTINWRIDWLVNRNLNYSCQLVKFVGYD